VGKSKECVRHFRGMYRYVNVKAVAK